MHNIFKWIISHQKTVLVIFALFVIISALSVQYVAVNYNLMDYLPEDASAVIGLNTMQNVFEQNVPSVRVMVPHNTIDDANQMAQIFKSIDGVSQVQWLGDIISINEPIAFQDENKVKTFYESGYYLYTLSIDTAQQRTIVSEIRASAGPNAMLDGISVSTAYTMENSELEVKQITFYVIIIVFLILLLTTSSWLEPILFMITIGAAIIINQGTNIIFGEISFLTNAAALVLQLAVSMDYAIFLLHRFSDHRHEGMPVKEAMLAALEKSFASIFSSATTTVFGFGALLLMRYRIGADLGLVLGKSVILSFISVMVLLPVLSIIFSQLIDKTHHKPLTVKFKMLGFVVSKGRFPVIALFVAITIIGFLAQSQNDYLYGISKIYKDPTLSVNVEQSAIEGIFGKENQMVIIIENGDKLSAQETNTLTNAIQSLSNVDAVISYTEISGLSVPLGFVPKEASELLVRHGYQRLLVTLNTPPEGDLAFQSLLEIEQIMDSFNLSYALVGETPNTRDLKNVVTADNIRVNGIAILAIGFILILTFKSFGLPFILLLVIESAIFINLGVPYLMGQPLFYISYLIISAVQLGATVDYAILFGSRYLENRVLLDKGEAALTTITDTGLSILTSAGIMAVCGFFLGALSSNQLIAQLGILIGRGACISAALVFTVLPCMLTLFDFWVTNPIKYARKKGGLS